MGAGPSPLLKIGGASALSALVALILLEFAARAVRQDGHARLPLYVDTPVLGLRPGGAAVGFATAGPYPVEIDERGLRAPSPARGVVLLGDSVAFGLGVRGEESLAARCTANGHPTLNAGVPGFALPDALARAPLYASLADGWMIVVNPWDDGEPAMADRAEVVGGWLLYRNAPAWARSFFASDVSRGQLLHEAVVALGGLQVRPPSQSDPAARGREVAAFVAAHPGTRVVWAGYPGDVLPDGRAVETERTAYGIPMETLSLHDAWLPADLHWSPAGSVQVAAQLCPSVRSGG